MNDWDEIRTAFQVARNGTVSGAAQVLGVHHATVIRHIDALEGRLGVKLFQRHTRGYTATEAGQDLLKVAATTDEQFTQLVGRLKGRGEGVSGDFVVTSLAGISPLLSGVVSDFQVQHPDLRVRYLTGERLFRLEYGEAHVAIRAGAAPDQPDNVVQKFMKQRMCLVAHEKYVERKGLPKNGDLSGHGFVSHDSRSSRAPFIQWLGREVSENQIVFRTSDNRSMEDAIAAGAGIGFVPEWELAMRDDLHEVMPSRDEWSVPMWLVTHVDLHRTAKVQAFLKHLKNVVKTWTFAQD